MRIDEFITDLRDKNIIVQVHEGQLAVHDPADALTEGIVSELKSNKEEIISFFNSIKSKTPLATIPVAPKQDSYPLSSAQKRIYFLYEFDKASTTYNMPGVFELKGTVDVLHLEKVFAQLISRHYSLRTVFELENTEVVQRVIEDYEFKVSVAAVGESNLEEAINDFIRPFDLSNELPIRVGLLKLSNGSNLLLVDLHHIISDGISMDALLTDFWILYQGEEPAPLTLQYKDYAVWQQSDDYQSLVNESKQYWERLYKEETSELLLPYDFARPYLVSHNGLSYQETLSSSQSAGLRRLSQELGVTLSTLFLSLYKVLLHKLSGSEDVIVGTATAGRHHADLKGVVGMFVNTLALRDNVKASDSFSSIVSKIHQTSLSALEHQLYQYEDLINFLGLERDTSRNPLFDVFYLYTEQGAAESTLQNLDIRPYHGKTRVTSKFDLSMDVSVSESDISIDFVARKDLFKSNTLARFMTYLRVLIDQVLHDEGQTVRDLSILSPTERSLILESFNQTTKPYDLSSTALDAFAAQVAANPEAIALIYNGENLSYGDLNARSDKWSSYLHKKGVSKGSVVAILMNRSSEMITAILSIFKLGCAYLPIAPDSPDARSLHMLSEMSSVYGSKLVLSNVEEISQEIKANYDVLNVRELDNYQGDLLILEPPISSDLAYVIYTSGSTGLPKGVCNSHRGLTNRMIWMRDLLGLTQDSILIQKTPYTFDVSVWELLMFTITGSKLVIAKPEGHKDPQYLQELIATKAIELIHFVPSMFRDFLDIVSPEKCKSLRQIVCSGEALPSELVEKCKSLLPWVRIYNLYGPTEAAIDVTEIDLTDIDTKIAGVSIGRPVANTQIYIVNSQDQIQPVGVPGELLIGGVQVANGYLSRQELTDKKFISNPFNANDEYKLYKTGDLAKWNSDGTISYLGRMDGQVKLNGVRIEPGEIERHLNDIAEVSNSAVLVREIDGNQHLIAYYIASAKLSEDTLRNRLFEQLPISMIPSYYVELEQFPTTSSGKLNRKSLPIPTFGIDDYVAPKSQIQKRLVEIWSEILNRDSSEISITHSFFSIGRQFLEGNGINQ